MRLKVVVDLPLDEGKVDVVAPVISVEAEESFGEVKTEVIVKDFTTVRITVEGNSESEVRAAVNSIMRTAQTSLETLKVKGD